MTSSQKNYFERLGRFVFLQLHPQMIYILLLFPLIISGIFIFQKISDLEEFDIACNRAVSKGKKAIEIKKGKDKLLERYGNSIPFFIDQRVESIQFLEKEKLDLIKLSKHPAVADKTAIVSRIEFIEGPENKLSFIEEGIQSENQIKETQETQRHPVQIDEDDLKKVLSVIEDVAIESQLPLPQSPQMIITDFRLKKLKGFLNREILEIDLKILKREFNP